MASIPAAIRQNRSFEWEFLERASPWLLTGVPVLVLIAAALPQIALGYWPDEVFSITASRSLSGLFAMFRVYENNMSLFQVILYFWMQVFGESEVATHSLLLLSGVITIPVFYSLERLWLNKTSSFFGALLLSVSPLFVSYTVETRSYEMLTLSVTISSLLYFRLQHNPNYRLAFLYGLSVAAGVYLHYLGLLIVLVHAFTFTRRTFSRTHFLPLLVSGLVAILLISPLVLFPPEHKDQVDWISAPGAMDLWYAVSALAGGGYVVILLAALMAFILIKGDSKKRPGLPAEPEKFAAAWALFPVLFLFAFSIWIKPLFGIRFFAWSAPGVALLVGIVLAAAGQNRWVKTVLWLLILGIFIRKTAASYHEKGNGFRSTVVYLNQQVKSGETVICYPYYCALDINFYLDQLGSKLPDARPMNIAGAPYLAGGGGVDPAPDLSRVQMAADRGGRVYLVCDGNDGRSRSDSIQQRTWLPQIRAILGKAHPAQRELMFEAETPNRLRVLVYE